MVSDDSMVKPFARDREMSINAASNRPVVIAGAGPVGLTCAAILGRLGVNTVVLERRAVRSSAPRAHVVNPRSLEIFRALDFDVPAMLAAATSPQEDRLSIVHERLTTRLLGTLPFEAQDDEFTPTPRINLAQPRLEELLFRDVRGQPRCDVRTGHRVVGVVNHPNRASVTAHSDADGEYELEADYVVACDGANSPIRQLLNVELSGDAYLQRCLTIHFEGSLRHLIGERPAMIYWSIGAQPPGVFLAYDIDRTWVYLSFLAPDTPPSLEEAHAIVTDGLGCEADFTIRHIMPWTMSAQVAEHYQVGRTFLAGDAAHRFPPSGGLGMNTGIQDVHNLAWKLHAVREGWATEELLKTYELERRAVAQINTDQSVTNTEAAIRLFTLDPDAPEEEIEAAVNGMYENFNSLAMQLGFSYGALAGPPRSVPDYGPRAAVGDRLPHAWCDVVGERRLTLDLLDPRAFTLMAGPGGAGWSRFPQLTAVPVTGVSLDSSPAIPRPWVDVTGLASRGAVLVRPDGHILGRAASDDPATLSHLARLLELHMKGEPLAALDGPLSVASIPT